MAGMLCWVIGLFVFKDAVEIKRQGGNDRKNATKLTTLVGIKSFS